MLIHPNVQWLFKFILVVSLVNLITACGSRDSSQNISPDNSLKVPLSEIVLESSSDCAQFKTYVTDSLVKKFTHIPQHPYYNCGLTSENPAPVDNGTVEGNPPATNDPLAGGAVSAPTSGPDGVSQTNNQEQGVNESDMVKVSAADGTLFIGHGSFLIIAKAFPPQNMLTLNEIDLGEQVINLFYDETNQRLIAMSRHNEPVLILASQSPQVAVAPITDGFAPTPILPETNVSIFNVVNPAQPILLEKLSIEGFYSDSRRIDNRLHLVTRNYSNPIDVYTDSEFVTLKEEFNTAVQNVACADPSMYNPTAVENDPTVIAAKSNLSAKITSMVAAVDVNTFLPKAKRGITTEQTEISQFLQCTDVHFPETKSSLGMQVITSMNTDGSNIAAAAIVNNSWLTYVSQSHLYMAEGSNFWWRESPNIDQTAIHKFSISNSKPQYMATGLVDGHVNNTFSMSEYQSVLRIATTQTDFENSDPSIGLWMPMFKNHLTILADDGAGKLNKLSEIRNIAVGETIRSARFIKERGFIVTFRNIDPLFTFDLSDPNKPVLKGKLDIPGFSSYIHPYDDNHLLTIGREGGENGQGTGNDMQLQLFDVTNMEKPIKIKSFTPNLLKGYSWSSAQYDHHAFTYYTDAKLLAIPVQISPQSSSDLPFSGIIAFKVTVENGFEEVGRVDHSDLALQYYCVDNTVIDSLNYYCSSGLYAAWATPRRSVVMTSGPSVYLYTISDVGLKAGEISDLNTNLGSLVFPPQYYPWYVGDILASGGGTGIAEPL